MSDSRPAGENTRPTAVIASEKTLVAPNAVLYLLVENVCFEISGEWEGREDVHEPLS